MKLGASKAADFRRIALDLTDAVESAHMGHPDFRVNGRIFATIHPDPRYGMVKLTPEQQHRFVAEHPAIFMPENGAWGRQGCTKVALHAASSEVLGEALTLAWRNATSQAGRPSRERKGRSGRSRQRRRPVK